MSEKPVEIFCPICGFTSLVKEVDDEYAVLPRDEKVAYIQKLQESGRPFFLCTRCDNPEQSAKIMEVR